MKRAAFFTLILFLSAIIYSSCKEDEYMDWKLLNDRWYLTLEDSLKKDTNFHKTSSGLYYKTIHQGYQRHPNLQDLVTVKYKGSLIDGSVFEKTTTSLYLYQTIKGWQEGIRLMQDGGHYIFYIPSQLAYDTTSTKPAIPPHSVLKFDIELLESN